MIVCRKRVALVKGEKLETLVWTRKLCEMSTESFRVWVLGRELREQRREGKTGEKGKETGGGEP